MGGRVAEEIFLGRDLVTTGCGSDMDKAYQTAYNAIRAGMFNKYTGYLCSISKDTAEYGSLYINAVDSGVKELLDNSYERTKRLLTKNKDLMHFLQ
mmetsp:Transcript_30890/g.5574  ORF Transcript_30890/g.5574 Transcript_30890/m.5574 type:complete len:96 (+) Transcript_30890:1406-1693(+)